MKKIILFACLVLALLPLLFATIILAQSKNTDDNDEKQTITRTTPENAPSKVLDLTNWKLTLPLNDTGEKKKPTEIEQPDLALFAQDPWFKLTSDKTGVVFRAPVKGPTTKNTKYARSELREMTNNGREEASWSSSNGTHTMEIEQAITTVPKTKPHVVAGQIHDEDDDVIVIRLEYPNLYVNVDGENVHTLDADYTLGERFKIKLVAQDGKTDVFYNDSTNPAYTLPKDYSGAYFKAGTYTQSNCDTEGSGDLCSLDNYGEVVIYNLKVTHQ